MKIILDDEMREMIAAQFKEWRDVADEYYQHIPEFNGWKRSPILRENRRESIVYGNCSGFLRILLNYADGLIPEDDSDLSEEVESNP